jgi:hypothetical protein
MSHLDLCSRGLPVSPPGFRCIVDTRRLSPYGSNAMTIQEVSGGCVISVEVAKVRPPNPHPNIYTINHIELALGPNRLRLIPPSLFFLSNTEVSTEAWKIGEILVRHCVSSVTTPTTS